MLWELLWFFQVSVNLLDSVEIPIVREHDRVIMEDIIKVLPREKLVSFNQVRKYHKVYLTSQLVMGDGSTIAPALLLTKERQRSLVNFPLEQPTFKDFRIWREGLNLVTGATLFLSPALRKLLRNHTMQQHGH